MIASLEYTGERSTPCLSDYRDYGMFRAAERHLHSGGNIMRELLKKRFLPASLGLAVVLLMSA
jgi:hypothetical protein